MNKSIFVLLITTIILHHNIAFSTEEKTVVPTMHKIFKNMQDLLPYSSSEEKFADPKNSKFILDKLQENSDLIKKAKHTKQLKTPTMQISQEVLENHFDEIARIYRVGNKSFARWQFNSTVPICMSCHTQAPSASRHWDLAELTKGETDLFNKAELLFMGRDFDSALKLYDELINEYPAKGKDLNLEKALERKVVIFSRVKRNFDDGIKSLEVNLKNKKLPLYLQKNIKAWIASFKIEKKEGYPNPATSNDEQIKKYATKELKINLWDDMTDSLNPRLVKNLTASGILYEYLNTHPKTTIKPDILYWLGVIDSQLESNLFYSLSDLYLKQCMSEFSSHPTAKKCFDQYKQNTITSYSGSAGTFLPPEVKKELKFWSLKVYGVDKSQEKE